jgi:hypothetical protein
MEWEMSCATLNAYVLHQLACERCRLEQLVLCLFVDCVAGIVSVDGLVCACVCMLSSCNQVLAPMRSCIQYGLCVV